MDIKRLDFDSEFFGFPVYRWNVFSPDEIKSLRLSEDFGVVYCFSDEMSSDTVAIAEALSGIGAVRYPSRVVFDKSLGEDGRYALSPNESIREIMVADEAVYRLAFASGHHSRFMKDTVFRPRCKALYEHWIDNGFSGDGRVYGFYDSEKLCGILSTAMTGEVASIELLSVDERSQRRGIARRLAARAEADAVASGAKRLTVATQGDNVAALAFYRSIGFAERSRTAVWHLCSRKVERVEKGNTSSGEG